MQTKVIERYFFFGLLLATLPFTFLIFRPFRAIFVLGISFSIVLYPLHAWFSRKMPDWLAATFTLVLFIIILCGPLLGIGTLVFNQSQDAYHSIVEKGKPAAFIERIDSSINQFLPEGIQFNTNEKISNFISFVSGNVANIFTSTLSAFFSFVLMLLIIFYFLKDGARWRQSIVVLSPLSDKDDEKIISRLAQAVNAVIKGYLLIALIQGILMGFGLWIFGIPNAALWGVVAAICSLLPTLGTALVSVPAIIFLLATRQTGAAVGLIIWAALAVGMIDNFLSPFFIGGKTNMPSLLILFAILGGISVLGPIGLLVGPLTISLLYTLISIYRNEFKQNAVL